MPERKYIALTPIEHDQKPYAEGAKLTLSDEQAEPLLALKAVELAGGRKAATPGEGADTAGNAGGDLVDAAGGVDKPA